MLKKALWVLLIVLVSGVLAALFYAWRALPPLDGSLRVPGLTDAVQVLRDDADVTHIKASNPQDAWFALGYVHAQERAWQLAFNRRVMHGTLSELLGPATLETDRLLRTLDIMGAAERQYRNLPDPAREALQRYSDGINTFFKHSTQALPPEFHLIGGKSDLDEPAWTPQDSVGWALMMALDLGDNWGREMSRLALLRVLDTEQLWTLMPPYPGEAPVTRVDLAALYRGLGVYVAPGREAARRREPEQPRGAWWDWSREFIAQAGDSGGKGSNNWALAGARTHTGKPLLANDPHLGLSAPAIWYFASLESPAGQARDGSAIAPLRVVGATLPGLPFVVLGRTESVAWTFTNTGPDVQDLYLERLDPSDPGRVQTPSGWQAIDTRTTTIRVKGQPDVTHVVRRTRHGPVISDAIAHHGETVDLKRHLVALRWSALEDDNRTVLAGLLANRARDVDELFAAFAHHHSPMQSAVAADTQGRIRMQAIGRVPLRRADNDLMGVAPAPGWDSRYDWLGWIPGAENPKDEGQRGWIATANQRITSPDYPHHLTQDWILPYRHQRIVQRLAERERHDLASMRELQNDVHSEAMLKLWPTLLQTRAQHPLAEAAMAELRGFDGQMRMDRAAPLIGAVWVDELARGLMEPRVGADLFKTVYGKRDFRAGIEVIVARNDPYWCGPSGCAAAATAALERALARIAAWQGDDVTRWRWGEAHLARSAHRPFDRVPWLARWFNVERPTPGDSYTVNVGQYNASEAVAPFANRHSASLRAIYDLQDLERSLFIYQTGQSGVVFSARYRDMASEWAQGQYRPLRLTPPHWRHRLTLTP